MKLGIFKFHLNAMVEILPTKVTECFLCARCSSNWKCIILAHTLDSEGVNVFSSGSRKQVAASTHIHLPKSIEYLLHAKNFVYFISLNLHDKPRELTL